MTSIELQDPNMPQIVAYEIECPRCYGLMTLYSESDNLFYTCEDCDFILHTIAKKSQ